MLFRSLKEEIDKVDPNMSHDFYIIPSSVHEVLLIWLRNKDDDTVSSLSDMIKDVNLTQVTDNERLSNCLYKYNSLEDCIEYA